MRESGDEMLLAAHVEMLMLMLMLMLMMGV